MMILIQSSETGVSVDLYQKNLLSGNFLLPIIMSRHLLIAHLLGNLLSQRKKTIHRLQPLIWNSLLRKIPNETKTNHLRSCFPKTFSIDFSSCMLTHIYESFRITFIEKYTKFMIEKNYIITFYC